MPTGGRDSVVEGIQWIEKNTFLDVRPAEEGMGMAPVTRQSSAPPSCSYSSDSSCGNSDAEMYASDGQSTVEQEEDSEQGAGDARRPTGRNNRRPCKGKRDRYKIFAELCQQRIASDPQMDPSSLAVPAWLESNPTLHGKLMTRLRKFQAGLNGGQDAEAGEDGPPAPKRAASPGALLPSAKRRAVPGASSSSALPVAEGSSEPQERVRLMMSL